MKRDKALTNISFDILGGSSKFLNLVLDNITCCILLLNDKMELQAYNDSLKTIFSNKKDEHILYQRCGEAIGCAYQVEEAKERYIIMIIEDITKLINQQEKIMVLSSGKSKQN